MMDADDNRRKQQEHEPDVLHRCFQNAANDCSPGAASQVIKHEQSKRPNCQLETPHIAEKVGVIELIVLKNPTYDGGDREYDSHHQRVSLPTIDVGRRHEGAGVFGTVAHLCRTSRSFFSSFFFSCAAFFCTALGGPSAAGRFPDSGAACPAVAPLPGVLGNGGGEGRAFPAG